MFRFKQAKNYYCGPACLRIVEYVLGRKPRSQKYWAEIAGTTYQGGTGIVGLKRALKHMGVKTERVVGKQEFLDLEGIWIVWDEVRDHWMVLHRVINQGWQQTLYDPLEAKPLPSHDVEKNYMNSRNSYALRVIP